MDASGAYVVDDDTTTSITVTSTHLANGLIASNNASPVALTIPNGLGSVGDKFVVLQKGAGQVTAQGDGTSTVQAQFGGTTKTAGQWAEIECQQIATDIWLVVGLTEEAA